MAPAPALDPTTLFDVIIVRFANGQAGKINVLGGFVANLDPLVPRRHPPSLHIHRQRRRHRHLTPPPLHIHRQKHRHKHLTPPPYTYTHTHRHKHLTPYLQPPSPPTPLD